MFEKNKKVENSDKSSMDVFRPTKGSAKVIIGNGVTLKGDITEADEVQIDGTADVTMKTDNLIVGGGMAYTFLKCLGNEIGNSIYDESKSEKALSILDSRLKYNCRLFLPSDISVTKDFSSGKVSSIRKVNEINHDEEGIDIGPDTIQRFSDVILNSKTVIWNGPMGVFETESFAKGTNAIATYVSEMTQNGGTSIIGGGDSASAIKDLGVWDDMTHISTGGGASLELLSGVDLPAFKVLRMI